MPRAKQRTPALRDRVLQVAVELLARAGIAGFTTREVARGAATSTPAVYELFGDKAGLVRGVFFEGFRLLRRYFDRLAASADPRRDVVDMARAYRAFIRDHPVLSHVMFSRPFADFDPEPAERAAGAAVREFIVARIRRCVDAGVLAGDPIDIAHVVVALTHGLAAAEIAARLGTSRASIDRRWALGVGAVLDGLTAPAAPRARDLPITASRRRAAAPRRARGAGTGTGARAGSRRAARARAR
ncbi:MAG TPA: TetR/AcrR family transcriptional regulator [Kofleriaceae bacterium]|nr:TetR/AcrR family transcriptional regulator [Kofleriaceae bacterium]